MLMIMRTVRAVRMTECTTSVLLIRWMGMGMGMRMIVCITTVPVMRMGVGMQMVVVVGPMAFGVIVTDIVRVHVRASAIAMRVLVAIDRIIVRRSDVAGFLAHWVLHDQALRFEEAGATTTGRTWKA